MKAQYFSVIMNAMENNNPKKPDFFHHEQTININEKEHKHENNLFKMLLLHSKLLVFNYLSRISKDLCLSKLQIPY